MTTIVSIVEGHGEVEAFPILLRRIGEWIAPHVAIDVQRPIPVKRNRFLKFHDREEFDRVLQLAALKCGEEGWILVLLDADDDCPATLAADILAQAMRVVPHRRVSVVLANREYEAWFIAAARSLEGQRGFCPPQYIHREAEVIRGAKEWISAHMNGGKYRETTDQPAFSARVDVESVWLNSRSFRKLCGECVKHIAMLG